MERYNDNELYSIVNWKIDFEGKILRGPAT